MAKKINHLDFQTETLAHSSNNISTEKKVTALTLDLKTVSATDFF